MVAPAPESGNRLVGRWRSKLGLDYEEAAIHPCNMLKNLAPVWLIQA